jgi:hypothetical protein
MLFFFTEGRLREMVLTLALFVLRIDANDHDGAFSAN